MNRDAPNFYGIIPARYASSRFPGKPLADIAGKPMFWHVYHRARRCSELSAVYLATDDERIIEAAQNLDVPALATRKDHPSGTDRVFEAAHSLGIGEKDVVLNIQGDEPVLDPLMVSELVRPFADPEVSVATPARRMDQAAAESPDRVKVVFSEDKKALYFSRSRIPYPREGSAEAVYGHIGMYAFRMAALRQFVHLPTSRLESIEKLEQLRLLENHIPVHVVITECDCLSVDRPEDIEAVVHRIHAEYARDSGKI